MEPNKHADPMAFRRRLGKRPAQFDERVPSFGLYAPSLPTPPKACDWQRPVPTWGDMLNTELGDCTIAGFAHSSQSRTFNATGKEALFKDSDIKKAYSQICGFNPRDPQNTDNGGVELDVLTYILKHGFIGHQIDAFSSVDPTNLRNVKSAIYLFGGVYIGLSLPAFAETQEAWLIDPSASSADSQPNSWGGHCVYMGAFDDNLQEFAAVSWGKRYRISYAFFQRYCDEVWGILSKEWIAKTGIAPNHSKLAELIEDMADFKEAA